MIANSPSSWVRRWWLWILVAVAAGAYFAFRILSNGSRIADEATTEAENLLQKRKKAYWKARHKMRVRANKLDEIKKIKDKRERLERLAEFAETKL